MSDARNIDQVFELRQQFWANGYRPVPVYSGQKKPFGNGWTEDARCDPPLAATEMPWLQALGTGILCDLVKAIDVDVRDRVLCDRIVALAEEQFGKTPLSRVGQPPKTLLVYRCETPFGKVQTPEMFLPGDDKCTKVEVLGRGNQFVADGIHPDTHKPYRWNGETPANVPLADLPIVTEDQTRSFITAASAILREAGYREREKPEKPTGAGKPHSAKLNGSEPPVGESFFRRVNDAALKDIGAWVMSLFPTAEHAPGTGAWRASSADLGRALEEDISIHPDGIWDFGEEEPLTAIDLVMRHRNLTEAIDAALWLCQQLGVSPESLGYVNPPNTADIIDELNQTYAVIRVVNRAAILNEHLDDRGHPTFSLLSPASFALLLANRTTEIPSTDKAGKPTTQRVPLAPYWTKHQRRRQYEGITFAPQSAPRGYYNLWQGFAMQPSSNGSCERFKEHLHSNVCRGSQKLFDWVFGWFADIFQHPADKCGTALVVRGDMGVGKTIIGETFGRLLGLHYVQVADPRYVTGRFNAHLVRCLLFHCDEAFWAGDRVAEGKLKDLVTGRQHPIELKGFEVFFIVNHVRMFINGNPGWLIPAGIDERRFATLDVADTHKQDTKYFGEIVEELETGGYERLLHELLTFDLSTVDLRRIPKTRALLDQKIASLTPEEGWWLDILKSGQLPNYHDAEARRCPARVLYNHYVEHTNLKFLFVYYFNLLKSYAESG